MKRIAVLGSTGSIGVQTLDVVGRNPERFSVALLVVHSQVERLAAQAAAFHVPCVGVCNPDCVESARRLMPPGVRVLDGMDAVCDYLAAPEVDVVVSAIVGFHALLPTLAAVRAGKVVALANKETLVAAGELVMAEAARAGAKIYPVDSEHSAIFQCLLGAMGNPVQTLYLTASGGPFRTWDRQRLAEVRREDALRHPNWRMGEKITVDSATLMNKGLEVIEAVRLFGVSPQQVRVVVHPQSVIHSMVEFADGAVMAQLGKPDMRLPIQLALSFPERLPLPESRLSFETLETLTFETPDTDRFPCLMLAYAALSRGGNIPCALNAANEAAVAGFLAGRLRFIDIAETVESVVSGMDFVANPSLDDLLSTHRQAFSRAQAK